MPGNTGRIDTPSGASGRVVFIMRPDGEGPGFSPDKVSVEGADGEVMSVVL